MLLSPIDHKHVLREISKVMGWNYNYIKKTKLKTPIIFFLASTLASKTMNSMIPSCRVSTENTAWGQQWEIKQLRPQYDSDKVLVRWYNHV